MGTIDDYLVGLDATDAAVIAHTYDVALEVAPEAVQGFGYGMPALVYRGKSLLSVMRAKRHFGMYPFSPTAIVAVLLLGSRRGRYSKEGRISAHPPSNIPLGLRKQNATKVDHEVT